MPADNDPPQAAGARSDRPDAGDIERHNQREIDGLNQRGGRMLSLVDLLAAGTVSADLAAELAAAAAGGCSFLTAAGPGGVGKTTLMGAMLAFLPPGMRIVTIEGPGSLRSAARSRPGPPECLLVHEIGSGRYYGYLWGRAVAEYFDLAAATGRTLVSNLHAETYPEAVEQLTRPPLGVSPAALARVDLMVFMAAVGGKRRVTGVRRAAGEAHEETWRWSAGDDRFERVAPAPADQADRAARFREFLARALADECRTMADLRRRAVAELFADAGL